MTGGWADVATAIKRDGLSVAWIEYNNLSIKAYPYLVETKNLFHDFGGWFEFGSREAAICNECGYMIVR